MSTPPPMTPLAQIAAFAAALGLTAAYLALTLSPWVLLAWPACAALFGLFVAIDSHRQPPHDVPPCDVPACEGCSSPLCPDCHPGDTP